MSADPKIIVVAEIHGLAGREGELRALLAQLAEASVAELGCGAFRALAAGPAGEFVVISEYADEAALRAHYKTDHYRFYRTSVGELLARPSDVVVHHVAETVHAVDPNLPDPAMLG